MRVRIVWSRLAVVLVVLAVAVSVAVPQSSLASLAPVGPIGDASLVAEIHEAGQVGASYAPEPTSTPQPVGVPTGPSRAEYDGLMAKAAQGGAVRVIIGLAAPFVPEGQLSSPQAVDAQQAAIAQAQDALVGRLSSLNTSVVARFVYIPYVALEVDSTALAALYGDASVTSIQEDALEPPDLAESGPLIGETNAWASGYTGAGWTVAVLDTGVDKTHPFLAGKVVSEACYSTTDAGYGTTTVCPDGPGQVGAGAAAYCPLSIAGCSHGTHVAGIVAGHSYSGVTFNGVAKDANIIAIQVFSQATGTQCGSNSPCALAFVSDQIRGLERVYALRNAYNIASVNMSLGGSSYSDQSSCDAANAPRKAAIDNLRSVNIATVISSGNSGYTDSMAAPGCISSAVSVGATTKADAVASYSNSASFLSLLAPGSSIISSVAGGGFASWNGTSMAAPHVAGAWAILKQAAPGASVNTVLGALQSYGVPITDTRNNVNRINSRIKLELALASLTGQVRSVKLPNVMRTLQPTPTRSPVTIADDFSDAASGWPGLDVTLGAAGYLSGQYRIQLTSANWFYWAYPTGPAVADFTAEIDAAPAGETNGLHGIAFAMDGTSLYAYLVGNGQYVLRRWDSELGNWVVLIPVTPSPYVNRGTQSNHMKVVRTGSTITIYVNGQQLGQITDSTLGSGHVGLLSSAAADNYDVRFDNYVVTYIP
jgi:subtilisin